MKETTVEGLRPHFEYAASRHAHDGLRAHA